MSSLSSKWRSSLAWRVTATIVLLSVAIITLVGSALSTQLTRGIFNEKLSISLADAEASAQSSELQLAIEQYQAKPDFKKVLDAILTVPNINGQSAGREVALFPTPKIENKAQVYQGTSNYLLPTSIPDTLRVKTEKGSVNAWQRVVLKYSTGIVENGIAVGNIISVPQTGKFEYYVLFSLNQQEQTLNLIHRALWLTGIALVFLLGLITWLIIRQVISPVREAAQIAEQLTAGDLEQRMMVKGENEIARLGYAFNEMAVALKQQINRLENLSRLQQ